MEGRCTVHSKQTRHRCKRPAILGGSRVCYIHGGAAPQVRLAAKERLAELVDPAIDRLRELILQTEFPSTAYAAVKDVLDRTGFKPEDKMNLSVTRPDENYDQMVKRFRELAAKLEPIHGDRDEDGT